MTIQIHDYTNTSQTKHKASPFSTDYMHESHDNFEILCYWPLSSHSYRKGRLESLWQGFIVPILTTWGVVTIVFTWRPRHEKNMCDVWRWQLQSNESNRNPWLDIGATQVEAIRATDTDTQADTSASLNRSVCLAKPKNMTIKSTMPIRRTRM
jgi:hypothetical protein